MTYAILQIAASAYADIRGRLVAVDEKLRIGPVYQREYIRAAVFDTPEHLVFGPVAFEALPEPRHVDDMNDAVLVGMAIEDDARVMWNAAATMHPDLAPPDWEKQSAATKAPYIAMATAVRRSYLARLEAASDVLPADPAKAELERRLNVFIEAVKSIVNIVPDSVIEANAGVFERLIAATDALSHDQILSVLTSADGKGDQ